MTSPVLPLLHRVTAPHLDGAGAEAPTPGVPQLQGSGGPLYDRHDVPGALTMRRPEVGDEIAARDPRTGVIHRATVAYLDMESDDSVTFMARPVGQPDRKAWHVWSRNERDRQGYVITRYAEPTTPF